MIESLRNSQWHQFSKSGGSCCNGFTAARSPQRNIQNLCILWSLNFHFFIPWGLFCPASPAQLTLPATRH